METDEKLLTTSELAQLLNISKKFIEKHAAARRLPGMVRIGRHWRFRKADVEKRLSSGSLLLNDPS